MDFNTQPKKISFRWLILPSLLFLLTLQAGYKVHAQVYVKRGLQIYYPFNGSAQDFSGQANDGIPTSIDYGPDRGGNDSGAAFFNGITGLVTSQFPASINVDFTVCGWAKVNSLPAGQQLHSMVGIEDFTLYFNAGLAGDTTLGFMFRSGGNYQSYTRSQVHSVFSEWFHFCITRNGQVQTQYINGLPADTQTVAAGFVDGTSNTILIGGSPYIRSLGMVGFYNGLLDDIRLYDRALSREELDTLSGRVPLAIRDLPASFVISRLADSRISVSTSEPMAAMQIFDLKGSCLYSSDPILPGQPFVVPAPPQVLVRIIGKKGKVLNRLVP